MRQFNSRHRMFSHRAQVFSVLALLVLAASIAIAQETVESVGLTSTRDKPLVVAIVISPGATLLDFAGPAEVFRGAPGRSREYFGS